MVTPGGMILEQPKMIAATDVLELTRLDDSTLCVDLVSISTERHECRVRGIATREAADVYLLEIDSPLLRLTFRGEETVELQPIGIAYRRFCEPQGRIDSATYSRSDG